ncbi:hypothetical protein [Deinococcus rubellus]|uniref:hypothetical protein n=1 Tax=Deinococcus rubellus TaxID=1889240 RepID=UPI0031E7A4C0
MSYCYYETASIDSAKSLQMNLRALWGGSVYDAGMHRQARAVIELARQSWSPRVNAAAQVAQAVLDCDHQAALVLIIRSTVPAGTG